MSEIENASDGFISRLGTAEKRISELQIGQKTFLKCKSEEKKKTKKQQSSQVKLQKL